MKEIPDALVVEDMFFIGGGINYPPPGGVVLLQRILDISRG